MPARGRPSNDCPRSALRAASQPSAHRPGRLGRVARRSLAAAGVASLLAACGGGGGSSDEAAEPALTAQELAVVIATGDPLSEAVGLAYQRARGVPDSQVIRLALPTDRDEIDATQFAALKADLDARLPARVQATLLTWMRPSRVRGACAMGITSALTFGYSDAHCGGCRSTTASPYFGSTSARPWRDHGLRPSMMLGAATPEEAEALIARGRAADGSRPAGTALLLRTRDEIRSVRWPDFADLQRRGSGLPGLRVDYRDLSGTASDTAEPRADLLLYLTGLAEVPDVATQRYLPGAVADHLTSHGGHLPDGRGQMPVTRWLQAGATASYGTVEEPCNQPAKFPQASVLLARYTGGDSLIEAYWKSVRQPGQGLFVGEPLARPWPR